MKAFTRTPRSPTRCALLPPGTCGAGVLSAHKRGLSRGWAEAGQPALTETRDLYSAC